jgi:hypothetical protein
MKASTPAKRRWGRILLITAFVVISLPLAVFFSPYGPWLGYLLATGPLGGAEIVATDASCGTGEYRIIVHQYRSGDGYLALTNKAGKVFDSASYTRGVDYAPFRWDASCKKVLVGSNDGLVFLEAK